jgi:hypothetical protein
LTHRKSYQLVTQLKLFQLFLVLTKLKYPTLSNDDQKNEKHQDNAYACETSRNYAHIQFLL